MRGSGVGRGEGVEDSVAGVTYPEGVPGDGASLGDGQLAAGLEEVCQLAALTGPGFQQREYAERHGHGKGCPFSGSVIAGPFGPVKQLALPPARFLTSEIPPRSFLRVELGALRTPILPGSVAVRSPASERRQAAVNDQGGSCDVASSWAGVEDDGSRELLRVTGPADEHARQLAIDVSRGELVGHLRDVDDRAAGHQLRREPSARS